MAVLIIIDTAALCFHLSCGRLLGALPSSYGSVQRCNYCRDTCGLSLFEEQLDCLSLLLPLKLLTLFSLLNYLYEQIVDSPAYIQGKEIFYDSFPCFKNFTSIINYDKGFSSLFHMVLKVYIYLINNINQDFLGDTLVIVHKYDWEAEVMPLLFECPHCWGDDRCLVAPFAFSQLLAWCAWVFGCIFFLSLDFHETFIQ